MKICPTCGLRYPNDATNCFVDRAKLTEAPDPNIGKLIAGRYRIEAQLGEGGMATVYAARSALDNSPVAIKMFRKELAKDEKLRKRFEREATSAKRLAHPHIIEIFDYGVSDDGTHYLVMEYLAGESLESLIESGPMPLYRALDIMLQVLDGLARAHDFEVVHRDLKPDNLFIVHKEDGGDHVKILDFGIARSMHDQRLTSQGEVFGTPQYMAPERITSIDAGASADLYAIGVILYQLVANVLPFDANDISGFLIKHLREIPVAPSKHNPQLPPALDQLILRLLEKDPAKRPVDAHAVIKELTAISAHVPKPQPQKRPPPPPPQRKSNADATPFEPQGRPGAASKGTLAPATFERWERRVQIFAQMLQRLVPDARTRPDLYQAHDRIRAMVQQMGELRQQSLREQMKLEAIRNQSREAQGRFGRAMDTLGQDLSRVREENVRAKQVRDEYAQVLARGGGPFAQIHAKVMGSPAAPTAELAQLYRQGLEALESLGRALQEQQRASAWLEAKEREAQDMQFQIDALRGQLAKLSQASEDESAQVQTLVGQIGSRLAQVEQALIVEAGKFADVFRADARTADLFRELEGDVN
jgi:serine/threonine-protein kinase